MQMPPKAPFAPSKLNFSNVISMENAAGREGMENSESKANARANFFHSKIARN